MPKESNSIVWKPQEGPQRALLECPVPDVFFGGARGGGKSDALLGDWLSHAHAHGKHAKGILFRQSMPELEELQGRALQIFPAIGGEWKAGPRTWYFRNGASLKMRWLERVEDTSKYQGHAYTWIGIDECGNYPTPEAIDRLRATMRSAHGVPCVLRLTGNPGGVGHEWLKERYIKPSPPGKPFWSEAQKTLRVYIPSRLQDNKVLMQADPGYVDRLYASGPSWLVKAWLEGDWDVSVSGKLFLRSWWQFYSLVPDLLAIFQVWDTGVKDREDNDPSACLTLGLHRLGWYVLDAWSDRVEYPELKRQVGIQFAKWKEPGCSQILIEDAASGASLIQDLRNGGRLPIKPVRHKNKIKPAYAVSPLVEAGRVFLPHDGRWTSDFIEQFALFPNGPHDEWVDCLTFGILDGPKIESAIPNKPQEPVSYIPASKRKGRAIPQDDDIRWGGGRK